ncbi:hypothetical protein ON010_g15538 [Phytophthora cinnamomi]|nr:hypothetical protein ON010_g15538 [Phytophthora cinnamomi]
MSKQQPHPIRRRVAVVAALLDVDPVHRERQLLLQPEEREAHHHAERAVTKEVEEVPRALVRHWRHLNRHEQVHKVARGRADHLFADVHEPDLQRPPGPLDVPLVPERRDGDHAQQQLDSIWRERRDAPAPADGGVFLFLLISMGCGVGVKDCCATGRWTPTERVFSQFTGLLGPSTLASLALLLVNSRDFGPDGRWPRPVGVSRLCALEALDVGVL